MTRTVAADETYFSSPGETVQDLLDERQWNQKELANRLGISLKTVNQLITGKAPLTEKTARKLVSVLGGSLTFWLNREANYRAKLEEQEQRRRLSDWTAWLTKLPVKDLIAAGAIPALRLDAKNRPALVAALLKFFSVASPDEFDRNYGKLAPAFRRMRVDHSDRYAIAAWLRLGEMAAEKITVPVFSRGKFKKALNEIRGMTVQSPESFSPRLIELCKAAGVTLVFVPKIPRAHVAGVTRWLGPTRPLIQMSLYGGTNDHFWFTFFHEAAHVLHPKKKQVIVDVNLSPVDQAEEQANAFARETLIPTAAHGEFVRLRADYEIRAFATRLELHPAIVLGCLQHDRIVPFQTGMNSMKESFKIVAPSKN